MFPFFLLNDISLTYSAILFPCCYLRGNCVDSGSLLVSRKVTHCFFLMQYVIKIINPLAPAKNPTPNKKVERKCEKNNKFF